MLLHKDLDFLQILEVPDAGLKNVMSVIQRDRRHHNVRVLVDRPADRAGTSGTGAASRLAAPQAEITQSNPQLLW